MNTYLRRKGKIGLGSLLLICASTLSNAQTNEPTLVDPNLRVRTVITGLAQPTSMAFIGANDFLVLEKASGKVQRVVNGALTSTVLRAISSRGAHSSV